MSWGLLKTAFMLLCLPILAWGAGQEAPEQIYQTFLEKSEAYRAQVEAYLPILESQIAAQQEKVQEYQQAYALDVVSLRELQEQERKLAALQTSAEEQRAVLEVTNQTMAELKSAYMALSRKKLDAIDVTRFAGNREWKLGLTTEIAVFFRDRFGRELPISAYGQTPTHDLLGFDHRERVDLALHPSTTEGQALLAYLRRQGISFIAFSGAVEGQATGAHIHLGPPSPRFAAK